MMDINDPAYRTDEEAVRYLEEKWNIAFKVSTLRAKRSDGTGPKYTRNGRTPLYAPADLDAYAQAQPKYSCVIEEPTSQTMKALNNPQGAKASRC